MTRAAFGSLPLARLVEVHGDALVSTHAQHGDATALVESTRIVELMAFLRDDEQVSFEMLVDLCAVDHLGEEPRFEVVYHLYSVSKNHRLRVKARVSEVSCAIDSVSSVWPSANWMEREAWDLYGIRFTGHPDLRRLLLNEEFEGHPLRKDYPKEGRQLLVGTERGER
ncbi:MAG: NADH-quinone oxidoreductase subunit C [Myxococcota bacterium]|nr:NADH-quinone oxidoreductase subunit C [Myxococcota bacterium]